MSIAEQFKIQQLEEEVKLLKMAHTQKDNLIRAAIIAIDDGDVDEAREHLAGLIGEVN